MVHQSLTCLVTIHGIGFQQPPIGRIPGYADGLHANLSKHLDDSQLSTDPLRDYSTRPGGDGPIYVQSCWPTGSRQREAGLARLGVWAKENQGQVDTTNAPLTNGKGHISHVALVYSDIEENTGTLLPTLNAGMMSLFSLSHYITPLGLIRWLAKTVPPLFSFSHRESPQVNPPFLPRRALSHHDNPFFILQQLQADVAGYVSKNEQRERIRSFVLDALLRLASRTDVERIIINAHSNGTVIAYDVLRQLPLYARQKIVAFVTAGSPLRKYVTLFRWGRDIESDFALSDWLNFWDEHDPVADPLEPPLTWHRESPIPQSTPQLFQRVDPYTGEQFDAGTRDIKVDNLRYSQPGGLQTHNYWDNERQFILPLVKLLLPPLLQRQTAYS